MPSSPPPIYCLSGLGADGRVFGQLHLPGYELRYIQWQIPAPGATMQAYAQALAQQITEPEVVLLGVSFGGMLATCISTLAAQGKLPFKVRLTLLVSSCKHRAELPRWMRLAGRLRLHRLVPYQYAPRYSWVNRLVFDTRSRKEELYLKSVMLRSTDFTFLKRAVHMILTWQPCQPQGPIRHIHGRTDRLLTPACIKPDYWVPTGGHFMVWNEAPTVSRQLLIWLQEAGLEPCTR